MSNFFIFSLLWGLTGNPIIAILVLLAIVYFVDRRFVGFMPSMIKPFVQRSRMSQLRNTIRLSPHDTSSKLDLARLLIEKKRFEEAAQLLQTASKVMPDSAEVLYDLGYCQLKLGQVVEGESLLLKALEINPRVRYGEPYLRMSEAVAATQPEKAMRYLEEFRGIHSSSIEGYYQMGQLYTALGNKQQAQQAYSEALAIYRGLPPYKKRSERKWAWMSRFKK
ncbi:MAG: tetratricopeptide repeat protein [Tumebacillaceae bacterium]